jgi:hypothetical protein
MYEGVWISCFISLICGVWVTGAALKAKKYLWASYSLVTLLNAVPLFVSFYVDGGYRTGLLIGNILVILHIFAFTFISWLSPSITFNGMGLLSIIAFATHLFLLHNLP